jgi:Kef-type K+ transport system membrane component KefB
MDGLLADSLTRFIAQIVAIIAVSRLIGIAARRFGQPMVIAEIIAGILLGPSLLGWALPEVSTALFAPDSLSTIRVISEIGLVLFMFLIGLELDDDLLRGRGSASVAISYTSILLPFLLGGTLSLSLYPAFAGDSTSLTTFALFMGAAMSITAFPVLARILGERRLLRSRVGSVAIACAAVDDVTTWCILAFVVASARATGIDAALTTTALAVAYVAVMLVVVRSVVARLGARANAPGGISHDVIATILVLLLISSWVSELIGIHALFGAFLFGAVIPKRGGFARAIAEKLEDLVLIALVPLFFAYSGLRTEIGLLDSGYDWAICGLIVLIATLGKAGGGAVAARISGLSWREAGALGVLLNTRGLMGLIVLNLGLDLGVISPTLFSMMIIMALATTLFATPLLERIYPMREMARDLVESLDLTEPVDSSDRRVLVCVSRRDSAAGLVSLAAALRSPDGDDPVHVLHLVTSGERRLIRLVESEHEAGLEALAPAMARAAELELEIKPLSFVSPNPADDICRVVSVREPDFVLLGGHQPGPAVLGGVAGEVARRTEATVAVLVDRGFVRPRRMLVPMAGSADDRAALAVARRLAAKSGAALEILEVNGARGASRGRVRAVDRGSPAAAALENGVDGFDLVIFGAGGEWGLEGGRPGAHARRLLEDRDVSLLLVKCGDSSRAE